MNSNTQIEMINIDLIIPNRFQPRLTFDENALQELANSIKEHGIIQPLVLRPVGDKYEIIAGERRYKAAQLAGLNEVPAIITNIDDNKSAEVALVENVQRKNLNAMEEAKSYKKILDRGQLTQEALAQKMGISQSTLANKLRLLNLAPEVQDALMQGKISERHARSLLMVDDKLRQISLLNRIINERLTVRQLDAIIKEIPSVNVMEPVVNNNVMEEPMYNQNVEQLDMMPNSVPVYNQAEPMNYNMDNPMENNMNFVEQNYNDNSIDSAVSMIDSLDTLDSFDASNKSYEVPNEVINNPAETAPNAISGFLDKISGPNYSSLEDETVNMTFDGEGFNPFNNLNIAESMPVRAEAVENLESLNDMDELPKYSNNIVPGDIESIRTAYNNLKQEIEKAGFKLSMEEFDFEDIYQLIIKVDKQA